MKIRGFSLIEVIIFITVIAMLYSGAMVFYFQIINKTDNLKTIAKLQQFAEQRMELILGRKRAVGTLSFSDPCVTNPSILPCSTPVSEGYTVTVTMPTGSTESVVTVRASKNGINYDLNSILAVY